jgi:hypothetical protein
VSSTTSRWPLAPWSGPVASTVVRERVFRSILASKQSQMTAESMIIKDGEDED